MDERIEQAFEIANYTATLSTQRRINLEEFNQKLVVYTNGGTFKVTPELISFTKTILDLANHDDVVFMDSNNLPINIPKVSEFLDSLTSTYFEALNTYYAKYNTIKTKRNVKDLVSL